MGLALGLCGGIEGGGGGGADDDDGEEDEEDEDDEDGGSGSGVGDAEDGGKAQEVAREVTETEQVAAEELKDATW